MNSQVEHSKLLNSLFEHSRVLKDKVAVYTTEGIGVTYAELTSNIVRAAAYLSAHGLKKGDRIMLSARKEPEFIYLYFGAHLNGIINVVVDATNKTSHLIYIASLVNPSLVFGVDIPNVTSHSYQDMKLPVEPKKSRPIVCEENDIADVMFTSGTTGKPKGVILSHFNIYSSASYINQFIGNTSEDIELLGLPLCHSFGLGRLRCNFLTGATVVLHDGFANIKSVFNTFERFGVTGFGIVPAVWSYIKRFSGTRIGKYASQMRYIEIGSAAMPLEDKHLLSDLFPDTRICMHYGLTEASRAIFMEFHEYKDNLNSIGRPVTPEVKIKIAREDDTDASVGEPGEIYIKGNMVTQSYFLPEDNNGTFAEGFLRTGDWGYRDKDGNVYLVARKKELINVGGKKVSPVEIEQALEEIGVGECMCIGVRDPNGILGEIPKVLLVKGTFTKSIDEIKEELKKKIEVFKLPKFYETVDSIPKTLSGKKQRILR